MTDHTRRGFLTITGAGAAAAGLAVVAPAAARSVRAPAQAAGPLVAYVTDMQGGDVTLFVGDREVAVHDPDLAARLARAAHR